MLRTQLKEIVYKQKTLNGNRTLETAPKVTGRNGGAKSGLARRPRQDALFVLEWRSSVIDGPCGMWGEGREGGARASRPQGATPEVASSAKTILSPHFMEIALTELRSLSVRSTREGSSNELTASTIDGITVRELDCHHWRLFPNRDSNFDVLSHFKVDKFTCAFFLLSQLLGVLCSYVHPEFSRHTILSHCTLRWPSTFTRSSVTSPPSGKSSQMEKDTINYMKYKMGYSQKILLADDAVPSKFHYQKDRNRRLANSECSRELFHKRQRSNLITMSAKSKC
ncbi:hypothetical protein EVAR_30846_1 [Eumeta japonica]|uniref:Uncharacterized protein n=1 Tax=Eumeta variegata TaxID=151549 RepID=A0A4C1XQL1_EUMVA|nr:hypothetical protein EVAR_30846_1 [Eumeta japonica]